MQTNQKGDEPVTRYANLERADEFRDRYQPQLKKMLPIIGASGILAFLSELLEDGDRVKDELQELSDRIYDEAVQDMGEA